MPDTGGDDFYVGYLPVPARDRRFLRWLLPALLAMVAAGGVLIAWGQKDPGTGQWAADKEVTLEGTITIAPYALLHTRDAGTGRTVLLVEVGKFGAAGRLRSLDGAAVKLRGTLLHRGGRTMLEIAGAADAVVTLAEQPALKPTPVAIGTKTVRGEIIDPKCYIGAMKPGGGKTHKACAELCIAGGIPPMLAAWEGGREVFYLLEAADGGAANDAVADRVGETVALAGEVEEQGDLLILRLHQAK